LIFRPGSLDVESANVIFDGVLVRVVAASSLAKENPHLQQIGTAELPLWAERDPSLGLAAAQAVKSSDVVQGT